jgi:hypothetical protein
MVHVENIEQPTTNIERPMVERPQFCHWLLEVRRWLLDVSASVFPHRKSDGLRDNGRSIQGMPGCQHRG